MGDKAKAKTFFDKRIAIIKGKGNIIRGYFDQYDLAGIYAFRGETKMAYENLNEVATNKLTPLWLVKLINKDPLFDGIRKEERFKNIVKQMEVNYKAEHDRVQQWLDKEEMKAKVERN